jgi:hypothetical protein
VSKKKSCWIAKQYDRGWRLGFCFGNDKPSYLDFWFVDKADIEKALKLNCVFVFMAKAEVKS